ncbi:prenyltransferase [Enterococcus mundtii]|uniref:prenyltransferase n=1 Tax=Enterococcus TaxID=1350 RepID=UPI0008E292A4|nr:MULTISPECIES: prenyltransferase [Enterococcus]MDB7087054.1 prenyltransferase [Enterococcus mundtii]SFM28463.1 hypothetical protein SAMN04487758_11735 [Enterococcus mundtii]
MANGNQATIDEILSHRYDNGFDYWATSDKKLIKGAPFSTLECPLYLLDAGVLAKEAYLQETANLILEAWREDGRFKVSPKGAIYPCHTAAALRTLCYLDYATDKRLKKTFDYFLATQEEDGGWKCNKYSFGKGPETEFSTPMTTLTVLDAFRFSEWINNDERLDRAVEFLLSHWTIKQPIGPCHHGIGTLFMQVEYPFRSYNLFYYVYVLSFYKYARKDVRFKEAFHALTSKLDEGMIRVERVVPKLRKLSFCEKGRVSERATERYNEILFNLNDL